MDQDNRSGWYDTSERREWYRQYSVQPRAEAPAPPPKKKHTGMKVTMIVLCVLILIVATAFAFSSDNSFDGQSSAYYPVPETSPSLPSSSGHDDYSDDFRDFFNNYYTTNPTEDSNISRAETGTGVTMSLNSSAGLERLTLQEIYAGCIDSIVGIAATVDGYDGYYWGTGIIMTSDGYILTNAHIIAGTDGATVVTSDGSEYPALLVGEDSQSDIAVLKIDATGLQPAQFGISDELMVGDEVAAIGNPLGDELSGTMTNGIISAINRGITVDGHVMTLLQTNAAINEGNSGGPLLNMYGQVIGITNMKMVADYSQATIEGIGFAIPTSSVRDIVNQLIETGAVSGRPGIGITIGAIPFGAANYYELPDGLYVDSVEEQSDAYAQGVREGDVLTAVNGVAVYSTADVNIIKDGLNVGDTLILTIFRDGKTFDVEIRLMDMNELY